MRELEWCVERNPDLKYKFEYKFGLILGIKVSILMITDPSAKCKGQKSKCKIILANHFTPNISK